jgi:hypothetical protein
MKPRYRMAVVQLTRNGNLKFKVTVFKYRTRLQTLFYLFDLIACSNALVQQLRLYVTYIIL